jgi:N-acetylglucosaminyldiphosphoundecaprenol N-acetyl-beta-D-mannosaminyltransferase
MQPAESQGFRRVNILGVGVHEVSLEALVEFIAQAGEQRQGTIVANANVQAVNLAFKLDWFRDFLNGAELVFCDGFGVRWAAQFLYGVRLHRHTPPDWFALLGQACARRDLTLYLLGAKPGVADQAARVLAAAVPGAIVVGTHHGYFDKSPSSAEQLALVAEINALHPHILVIGFGMPIQERWILENRSRLNVGVLLPVGAMFDYVTGTTSRAPRWMTENGLEWLGRLVIEPKRLWKRYILGNPLFCCRVLLQKFNLARFGD